MEEVYQLISPIESLNPPEKMTPQSVRYSKSFIVTQLINQKDFSHQQIPKIDAQPAHQCYWQRFQPCVRDA